MRLVTYQSPQGPRLAGLRGGALIDLNRVDPAVPVSMKQFLAQGATARERAAAAIDRGEPIAEEPIRLLAPIPDPEKVICIGLNYADHAAESGSAIPDEPVVFNKFPTAVVGHDQNIILPKASAQVDYEAELVVVIGRQGRHIPQDQAFQFIAGYCCGHDVSARDWQLAKSGGQWLLGKSFDTFAPFGPALVTADQIGDPGDLNIQLRLNGQVMQQSSTRQLIFPVDKLVAYLSGICTLRPGDVIFTGTPPGVGFARKPPVFLQAGDAVEVEIEGLGVLRNAVVAE